MRDHSLGGTAARLKPVLLVGASMLGLCAAGPAPAQSINVLRNAAGFGSGMPPLIPRPTAARPLTNAQQSASLRALATAGRAQSRKGLSEQAQAAARASVPLSSVPNGLVAGGLVQVANPVSAALDGTGYQTWQGASGPVQTTTGDKTDVAITQTESRAILSWESFNVGSKTTLTFNQKKDGVAQKDWVALNRVVGKIDPATGRQTAAPTASQIMGTIKADGTVLVLNQAGVMFGAGATVNTHSLLVSSLEIGRNTALAGTTVRGLSLRERNEEFLSYGLLGFRDQASAALRTSAFALSPLLNADGTDTGIDEGEVRFETGAQIRSGDGGFIIGLAPRVYNGGALTSLNGQIGLHSGRRFFLDRSEGNGNSLNPFVRGLIITSQTRVNDRRDYVINDANGLLTGDRGYISFGASARGAALQQGVILSSTGVARNGAVTIEGGDIRLDPDSMIWIRADSGKETIPQGASSIANFKTSQIVIGDTASRIEIGADSLLLAPSADVTIGAPSGAGTELSGDGELRSRVFIDAGATIDVSGVKDFVVSASRNQIRIDPVKGNELRDTPLYQELFLNGATVLVDPRLSGVRADGVRWVGSPLIEAESYYAQVGVTAAELMTRGGNVALGVAGFAGTVPANAPDIIVKQGATIDISGGWVRYEGGDVTTTRLRTRNGLIVDIGAADPNGDYVGIVSGFTQSQPRHGLSETYANPLLTGVRSETAYTEGRDAGSLTLKGSALAFDGTLIGNAYAGWRQQAYGGAGGGSSGIHADVRALQSAPSDMPAGGFLNVQALSTFTSAILSGGGDIRIGAAGSIVPIDAGLGFGQSFAIDADGELVLPDRSAESLLDAGRRDSIQLTDAMLNGAGLSAINLQTSGAIRVDQGADVVLAAGGAFTAVAGRSITIDGAITTPGGLIGLQTVQINDGSVFADDPMQAGSFDITVNGTLSTRGRWANDFGNVETPEGGAFTDGGTISMAVASRVAVPVAETPQERLDISGSILVNDGALLDVSGGGYVDYRGEIDTSARGGDLTLISQTNYFQLAAIPIAGLESEGNVPGIRVTANPSPEDALNPARINARVLLAEGSVKAHGFAGGGTFALTTPAFRLGRTTPATGTALAHDFFSETGFATYDITSYGTSLTRNRFDNGLGGYNALLATQTVRVRDGEALRLSQSRFSPVFDTAQQAALTGLASGGDLYSVLAPKVMPDAFDRLGVDLKLGGLLELHVEQGGKIVGDAGASITASKFWNEGVVRLIGGDIVQVETLPTLYAGAVGARRIGDFFTANADGSISEGADNALGIRSGTRVLSNAELAVRPLYLTGALGSDEGIRLSAGSFTNLSGASIRNPRILQTARDTTIVNGTVIGGGRLISASALASAGDVFARPVFGEGVFASTLIPLAGTQAGRLLTAESGASIDISGAADRYTYAGFNGLYVERPVWSAAGAISVGAGGTLAGSNIDAHGGAPSAAGGTLTFLDPVLVENYGDAPAINVLSATQIEEAGFDSFVALGSLTGQGNVSLALDRGFFLQSRPVDGTSADFGRYLTTIAADGRLTIDAAYIGLSSIAQSMETPLLGEAGDGKVVLRGRNVDVSGAVLFDRSVSDVEIVAFRDLRLIGARPIEQVLGLQTNVANSLRGQLMVNGDLQLTAARLYPTTGSTFLVASAANDGVIRTIRASGGAAGTPYSAGAKLLVQASAILHGGAIYAPLGELTLGSTSALTGGTAFTRGGDSDVTFAPVTRAVTVDGGSITSVSAKGLSIPYGITTDQIEWYFTPTDSDPLEAPPTGVLKLAGRNVTLKEGATIDISGGGDVYAYEFVPGTGGSRDVLDRFNNDPFSSNDGLQYPDGRQVYAIVPGLSTEGVAAVDPIYSADYGALYDASAVGRSVYLQGVAGLKPGWYTLLPAKYALLPGGMRVVEMPGDDGARAVSGMMRDGSMIATGYYGVSGTGIRESLPRMFMIQSQPVFRQYSNIVTTSANQIFAARAARNGVASPVLPVDAGRIILEPIRALTLEASLTSGAGDKGRGARADISGDAFRIVSAMPDAPTDDGVIVLTADGLTGLGAQSLFIGGSRQENADGTTNLRVDANRIAIENDVAHALKAPELIFAVDGEASRLIVADGASVTATGSTTGANTANYVIDGDTAGMTGQGAVLRVANGPERLVDRVNIDEVDRPTKIRIGGARLTGQSVLIGSSGDAEIEDGARISATSLALEAGQVSFGSAELISDGLVITPNLRARFGDAEHVTIRSAEAIRFEAGNYVFGDVTFDSAGFLAIGDDPVAVRIRAGDMRLENSGAAPGNCTVGGALACGSGTLALTANRLTFGDGAIRTYGFGSAVTINAANGIRYDGIGSLNVGSARLTLNTPTIADAAVSILPDVDPVLPALRLVSTGTVKISGTPGAALAEGTPGGKLSIDGRTVTVSGTKLRATAGQVDIRAEGDVTIADGAVIEAPAYAKQFGDAADPYLVSAPGGAVSLTSTEGDVLLDAASRLSVGGAKGRAGTLRLGAAAGEVILAGTIDGTSPDGGGSLLIDTGGAFDLSGFAGAQHGFTGALNIRAGTGDLALAAGSRLDADSLLLAAENGFVDIGGTIDTSGVNGGDIALFGRSGVVLRGKALLDAHATGYAATDSRQAFGGDVLLGTDGSGRITLAGGSKIDVSATRPGNRLIPVIRNGETLFSYAASDLGGTVTLRAPIIERGSGDTVKISSAGTITGARTIAVEAFKRYDLADIAADTRFTGVRVANGEAILNTGQVRDGRINFLSDIGNGTIPDFIRGFDISDAYANLGGMEALDGFVARAGVELAYAGDIRLASNWNFAAADVDVEGAVAAGVMRESTFLPGKFVVNAGREAELLENHADFRYRVGGSVRGAAGALTLRAGGDLTIAGSISDGLFTFGDQTDPTYLDTVIGGGGGSRQITLPFSCFGPQSCPGIVNFSNTSAFFRALVNFNSLGSVSGGGSVPAMPLPDDVPYSAAANSAAALGAGANGQGDPLGSASIFPLLGDGSAVSSWSYRLVGGAELDSPGTALPSVDPLRTDAAATGSVSVVGERTYQYGGGAPVFADDILLSNGSFLYSFEDFVSSGNDPRRPRASGYTTINLAARSPVIAAFLRQRAIAFFAGRPSGSYRYDGSVNAPTSVSASAADAEAFLTAIEADLTALVRDPANGIAVGGGNQQPSTAYVRSFVRTGTGAIDVAAAGDVDLTNGRVVTRSTGGAAYQVGGTAIYTVGQQAATGTLTATDPGGTVRTISLAALAGPTSSTEAAAFRYGRGDQAALAGILVADPVYATGGGDVAIAAGADIIGRRDVFNEVRTNDAGFSFIGASDQPWRVGEVGQTTNLRINPQLFTSGIGTLGGGSLALTAGGDVTDLTLTTLTSVTTGDVLGTGTLRASRTLVTYGGGDVVLEAGGDLRGGRLDIASGAAKLAIAGSIRSAGTLSRTLDSEIAQNLLRIRLSDATVDAAVGGSALLQGIAALGANRPAREPTEALNSFGFYSAKSAIALTANGGITVLDRGAAVTTGRSGQPVTAVYPASVTLASLTGDMRLTSGKTQPNGAQTINLFPSATGQLRLLAGGDIAPVTMTMEDRDPGLLPGYFSTYQVIAPSILLSGQDFNFPAVLPDSTDAQRAALHNRAITHLGDAEPVRVFAGGDIVDMILSSPKQVRIGAGRDILNMMLFAQNIAATDISRVVAGRDIIATARLTRPLLQEPAGSFGDPQPALQGNLFVIGGPGRLSIEAGRDAGPFLNSAVVDPQRIVDGEVGFFGELAFGGGIISIGNDWNAALPTQGADIDVLFGVARGADYAALRDFYLDPANIGELDDDLFVQVEDANGNKLPDRTRPIYGPILIAWMKANAPELLTAEYATTNVDHAQAFAAFLKLPELRQRDFLLNDLYFNELEMTSRPDGPSFLQYSRGYRAVNMLFSPALGYTENNLEGGEAGASETVETGNLDLRLATIQTARGGGITLVGPGGRILAGSTVRTSEQAARRTYDGARLYSGDRAFALAANGNPRIGFSQIAPAAISAIPTGYEGIITLRGGAVRSFTDRDLLLNQSRLFTQGGGDITLWSSNGDLNAGQGPKSAANFPPVVVRINENGFSQVDAVGGVSGAGIAAFQPAPGVEAPDVYLIAPRGTVDAGDAGVRVAGNLFVAAAAVANADNFQVGGSSIGVVSSPAVDAGSVAASNAASAAAAEAAKQATATRADEARSQIFVEVLGYAGGDDRCDREPRPADCPPVE